MALIICPECSRQVSELAPHCPHCGFPIAGNPLCSRQAARGASTPSSAPGQNDEVVLERSSTRKSPNGSTATYSAASGYNGGYPDDSRPAPDRNRKRHSGLQTFLLAFLGIIIALVIVMFVTCPSAGDHRREVRQLGEKAVKMYAAQQDNMLITGMTFAFGDDLVDMVISKLLEVDNYGVVSIGRLDNPRHPSKSQIVSVGVFGHVFTASPEDLVEGLANKLKSVQEETVDEAEKEVKSKMDEVIEEAKESARKKTEQLMKEAQEEVTNKIEEKVNEVVEQTNDDLFDNKKDEEKSTDRSVEKP